MPGKPRKPSKKRDQAERSKLSSEAERNLLLLKSEDASERRDAVNALGRMGGEEVVKPLVKALRDRAPTVRSCAAHWLGEIGGGSASEALLRARLDPNPNVQSSVSLAIRKMFLKARRKRQK